MAGVNPLDAIPVRGGGAARCTVHGGVEMATRCMGGDAGYCSAWDGTYGEDEDPTCTWEVPVDQVADRLGVTRFDTEPTV